MVPGPADDVGHVALDFVLQVDSQPAWVLLANELELTLGVMQLLKEIADVLQPVLFALPDVVVDGVGHVPKDGDEDSTQDHVVKDGL